MKLIKKIALSIFALGLSAQALAATAPASPKLQGKYATVAEARRSASYYSDGTNIMVLNWSHSPVDVEAPLLGEDFYLSSISGTNNGYYMFSPFYWPSADVFIYDHFTGELIAAVDAENPSTVEIWDADDFMMNKMAVKSGNNKKALRVITKHSI